MKQLTLIRHARSCKAPGQHDFGRPLSEQGRKDAHTAAERLRDAVNIPDLILSSGAERALGTAEIFASALNYPPEEIEAVPDLYSGYDTTLINLLQNADDHHQHLLLVGHNPGITQLARFLSGQALPDLSPCSLVNLHLTITQWCELAESCATLRYSDQPERLAEEPRNQISGAAY